MRRVTKLCGFFCALAVLTTALPATGQMHLWSNGYGGTGMDWGYGVAMDGPGSVALVGFFNGTANFGGGPLVAPGASRDIVLAKYNSAGVHLWSKRFGSTGTDTGHDVIFDSAGNVVFVGTFAGTVDFGGGPLVALGSGDIIVAKYDPNGVHIWSRHITGVGANRGFHIEVDGADNVAIAGITSGTVDFGGGPVAGLGSNDVCVAKYSSVGALLWAKVVGGTGVDQGEGLAMGPAGNVWVTGVFNGTADFGGGPVVGGFNDIFIVKYNAVGTHKWDRTMGSGGSDRGFGAAVDGSGNIICTGTFRNAVDFGGGMFLSAGGDDIWVAKYNVTGGHVWSKQLGSSGAEHGYGITVGPANAVLITGGFGNPIDFGGGTLTPVGSNDIYVAKYDGTGAHLWSQRFGSTSPDIGRAIVAHSAGDIVFTGYFNATIDFGGGPFFTSGGDEAYLVRYTTPTVAAALVGFGSYWMGGHVEVAWRLIDIEGDLSFDIARREEGGNFGRVDNAVVARRGDEFVFEDHESRGGTTYEYRVAILENGEVATSFETRITTPLAKFALEQNHPNPFTPETQIGFSLDEGVRVHLAVYDVTGRLIATLVNRPMPAGPHTENWNGMDDRGTPVASGAYFYRLTVGNQALTRKAVLLR